VLCSGNRLRALPAVPAGGAPALQELHLDDNQVTPERAANHAAFSVSFSIAKDF